MNNMKKLMELDIPRGEQLLSMSADELSRMEEQVLQCLDHEPDPYPKKVYTKQEIDQKYQELMQIIAFTRSFEL